MSYPSLAKRAALFATALCLAFAPLSARAQDLTPEHLALAKEFAEISDRAAVYESAVVQVGLDTMRQLMTQYPDEIPAIETAVDSAVQAYAERKDELFDQFARVYAIRFSVEELQQIVDFYRTPVGEKILSSNDEVNQELALVLQVYQNNLQDEFLAMVRANLREAGVDI